jgi:hypothetical protein
MNNDVIMMNKEHETFQFTQLNNNIKHSKKLINLLMLLTMNYLSVSLINLIK